jgi:DNA-binding NtrC family response regulator
MRRHPRRGAAARPPAELLGVHRNSLSSVLVLGGGSEQRRAVAQAFHRASPLGRSAFLVVDCAREEAWLCAALQHWLFADHDRPGAKVPVECGTIFLERVGSLSLHTQELLLELVRRLQRGPLESRSGWGPLRLAAANPEALDDAVAESRFSLALYDCLDKIRIELGPAPRRGAA